MPIRNKDIEDIVSQQLMPFVKIEEDRILDTKAVSIKHFLEGTSHLPIEEAERLRRLGIALENDACGLDQLDHWTLLRSIYQEAIRLDPDNIAHHSSMAISAKVTATRFSNTPNALTEGILLESIEAFQRAAEIQPDALVYYNWGLLYYEAYFDLQKARAKFELAVQHNPEHYMARLYLGHCYFDAEDWQPAFDCFHMITEQELVEYWGQIWRYVRMVELMTICQVHLGNRPMIDQYFSVYRNLCQKFHYQRLEEPYLLMQALRKHQMVDKVAPLQRIQQLILANQ